ncbi:sensor histidine kinase [Buchananella hordeovulneris]|uniref:sensor histidine kinase n=1 Tax=Buchananella hordeovulneris TaxID=52770 RepID=UPI0026DCF0A3|nr:HAMP domain-containing sensor histidine kinase [Buchananella hordeovulneris]MDO5080903.1 HAMP domain-containing sensor histidine kinase [Buchananella hordeovulneris]
MSYCALFVVFGVTMIGLVLWVVARGQGTEPVLLQEDLELLEALPRELGPDMVVQTFDVLPQEVPPEIEAWANELWSTFLWRLTTVAAGVLLVLTVVSAGIGWLVAGRVLRPLGVVSAAARRAAGGDLSQRLTLGGPRDEVRQLADTFDSMLGSLEESFAVHQRFAANASHELRTPVATTQTMIDVALADPDLTLADAQALLRRVREVNQAAAQTIDGLLDLAVAQAGALETQPVALGELAADVCADLEPLAARQQVTVQLTAGDDAAGTGHGAAAAPGVGLVQGDVVLLRQAVSNLVRNGIMHNEPGGEVAVTVGNREVTVRNTGPHVAAADLQSLCEPFVRGAGRATTRGRGHGLGLALVQAVATAHKGTLELRANPGGGLTVVLRVGEGERRH